MRTLKKTLCLVLALVMVLGLCAVSVAAEFTDADEIKYDEAVGVMAAAKVLDGFDDGSFRPEATLTRAQAAKMIACMMDMGDLKGTANFTDVPATHWASSYIAFCASEGIVVGNGDGTFSPERKLKGSEWAKMVIGAIGYNAAAEGITGSDWEIACAKKVKELKLAVGIADFDGSVEISREEACELAFQGMNSPIAKYTPGITVNGVEIPGNTSIPDKDDTLLARLGVEKADAPKDDAFGRPASTEWVVNKGKATEKTVYTASKAALATVDGADLTARAVAAAPYKDWVGVGGSFPVYYNGSVHADIDTMAELEGMSGATIEFYGSKNAAGKTVLERAVVTEYYFATIDAISAKTGDISLKVIEAGQVIAGTASTTKTVKAPVKDEKASANYTALKDFAKDDVLAVCLTQDWDKTGASENFVIMDVVKATPVEGKVTAANIVMVDHDDNAGTPAIPSYSKSNVTVGGTKYYFANEYARQAIALKSEGTLYLAPSGKVIGFVGKVVKATETVAFLVGRYNIAGDADEYGKPGPTEYYVQALDMDGKEISYRVTKAVYDGLATDVDGLTLTADVVGGTHLAKVTAGTDATIGTVYSFAKATGADSTTAALKSTDKRIQGNDYYASDVKFIYVTGAHSTLKVTVKSGVQTVAATDGKETPSPITKAYIATPVSAGSSNNTVSVVFVSYEYETPVATTSDVAFVAADEVSTDSAVLADKDGKEITGYAKTIYIDGKETDVYVAAAQNDGKLSGFYTVSKNGDITVLGSVGAATNLIASANVVNVYDGMLTYQVGSADAVQDVPVAEDAFINVIESETVTSVETLTDDCEVALVLAADGKSITTIYLIDDGTSEPA